ncbi:MAG: MFS transporter [Rickettsiales bacterium]
MIKSRKTAYTIWILASIFYAYQYILRVMPSVMIDEIMEKFHFDASSYGQFSGLYYIGYSAAHLPLGIMLDRIGPKKVMPICLLLTVLGQLPIVFSDYWAMPIAGRVLTGIGSSAAILGTFKIIRLAFDEKIFTRMLGWSVTIGLLGAIYGGGPVTFMTEEFGYQSVINIFAVLGLVLAAATYFIVPEIKAKRDTRVIDDIKSVLMNGRVIAICMLGGLMVGPLEGFADVWGAIYLRNVYDMGETISASLPSLIFIGMSIGAPMIGYIADKTGKYIGTTIAAGVIMALGYILFLSSKLNVQAISVTFVTIGICCAYQIIVIYKASTYVKEHVVSLTNAAANMIIMSFGYLVHTVIGVVIDYFGGRENVSALNYGVSSIPVMMTMAIIGLSVLSIYDKRRARREMEITQVPN